MIQITQVIFMAVDSIIVIMCVVLYIYILFTYVGYSSAEMRATASEVCAKKKRKHRK